MSFTAQPEVINPPPPSSIPELDLNRIVRLKYEALKEKGEPKLNLTRSYQPANHLFFDTLKTKLKEMLVNSKEGENSNIDEFMPLIFGVLEGCSGLIDPMLHLTEYFGDQVQNLKIEDMIKQRTKVLNYGIDKRKGLSVLEVDKATLASLAGLYDTKLIKAHRKMCQGVRNYFKSWRKLRTSIDASDEAITEESDAYKNYVQFMREELTFNSLKMPLPKIIEQMVDEAEEKPENDKQATPLKEKKIDSTKNGSASTQKTKEGENGQIPQENGNETKSGRVRRTKDEIERDRILKQQEKEEKRIAKEEKEKQKLLEKERQKAEKAEKEKLKELEKEKERKAKQEEKEAKERERQIQIEAKQKDRLEKEAEKRRKEEEKEKKSNPGKSLYTWFKPKQTSQDSPSKENKMEEERSSKSQNNDQSEKQCFLRTIMSQNTPLCECQDNFFINKMKDENYRFEPYYVNIFSRKSRLEFTKFLITQERITDYTLPHEETDAGKYDDSSVEYEDLCGDVCNEDIDVLSAEEEEQSEDNSAIVPDSYFEVGELSEESEDDVVINLDQGGEWHFSSEKDERAATYEMFTLFEETFPLTLTQPEQSNELPVTMKCQLYKEIHGFHGTKDALVKELALINQKVPKSYFYNLIRETTTKKANQRVVKPEIIEFLNEQKEGYAKELEEIKAVRDEEIRSTVRERVTEKERQLERLILEEAGTYYIVDLLQFLREKGYRMPKKDLISFIEGRVGSHWDDIRRRMKKMLPKDREKMNQFLVKKDKEKQEKQQQKPQSKQQHNSQKSPKDQIYEPAQEEMIAQ